jgi:chromatin segregation and condensation protein Rec8/ScpA/Scc1 (kleisin family)
MVMGQGSNNWDAQKEIRRLLSKEEFPEEGKKVLRAISERINNLKRENQRLIKENTELQALNSSLQQLMKTVEDKLNQWRGSYMRNG